jgi:hypothetical protein
MLTRHQNNYFDVSVKNEIIKETISSPREYEFQNLLISMGFKEGKDFIHQFACLQEEMGKLYVADFAFPDEKVIIELDGKEHKGKKKEDHLRDKVFGLNGFQVIRIKTPMDEYHGTYWKYFIKELINYIREIKYGKEPELD